eukprot:CAMPEP_0182451250 /NCGR_PEP_ID=MMETSP1172-20130603/43616_1 /TAXON_ID=708627 /ORGANISM="Timspurckia oligopyrenoides, Strain CCMP3278" /LENGTH=1024 /DNA_ID=CAMNT_0024649003 /DNA_START=175 /DNA_END=3249 /DNA_ORIENTATION=-
MSTTNETSTGNSNGFPECDPTGRYQRTDHILGRGAYKTVYKAFDTELALEVAWNMLEMDRLSELELSKVANEVELLSQIQHKNIISFYGSWQTVDAKGKKRLDFITELMMSGTLKEYVRKARSIKLKVIRRWGSNILEAINYLHTREPPIMHRDLKCDNIFINGHVGEVKIGDLGLSSFKERERAFTVIGTPEFMAPELYEESYTEKVDIYAFGMCLLEMLTMEYPYQECQNPAQVFRKVLHGEKPISVLKLKEGDFRHVILMCLEKESNRPSAAELLTHPLFKDWASDDGMMSNTHLLDQAPLPEGATEDSFYSARSKLSMSPKSSAAFQGISLHNLSDATLLRNLMKASSPNAAGVVSGSGANAESADSPPSQSDAARQLGDIKIGVHIPVDGAVKLIEFSFNANSDLVEHVAAEMVSEFELSEVYNEKIQNEIEGQIEQVVAADHKLDTHHLQHDGLTSDHDHGIVSRSPSTASQAAVPIAVIENASHKQQQNNPKPQTPRNGASLGEQSESIRGGVKSETMSNTSAIPVVVVSALRPSETVPNLRQNEQSDLRQLPILPPESMSDSHVPHVTTSEPEQTQLTQANLDFLDRTSNHGHDGLDPREDLPLTPDTSHVMDESVCTEKPYVHDSAQFALNMMMLDAAARGKREILKAREAKGANLNFTDYDRRSALHLAAAEGHAHVVEYLLSQGCDAEEKDRWGRAPVEEALSNQHVDVLEVFRRYGISIDDDEDDSDDDDSGCNSPNNAKHSLGNAFDLAAAAEASPAPKAMKESLTNSQKEILGMEMLEFSARGFVDLLKEKLMVGGPANYADYDRRTALHLAASEGHAEVAELLLLNGADVNARDRFGRTPVDDALKSGHRSVLRSFRQFGVFVPMYLLDPSTTSPSFLLGMDLIQQSALGNEDGVNQLLSLQADPNFQDYDLRTPLHLACAEGHLEMCKLLLSHGAKLNAVDRFGGTPRDDAQLNSHSEIVMYLDAYEIPSEQAEKQQSRTIEQSSDAELGVQEPCVQPRLPAEDASSE